MLYFVLMPFERKDWDLYFESKAAPAWLCPTCRKHTLCLDIPFASDVAACTSRAATSLVDSSHELLAIRLHDLLSCFRSHGLVVNGFHRDLDNVLEWGQLHRSLLYLLRHLLE